MPEVEQIEEPGTQEAVRRVVVEEKGDPIIGWLGWAIAFVALMLGALAVYAAVTGVLTDNTPRTAEEAALATSAAAIRANPTNGAAYAERAEALFKVGRVNEAHDVLDQGEKAVGEEVPAILFILRTRTMLLNQEERFTEAEEVGNRAIAASDKYLSAQFKELVGKGLSPQGADSKLTVAAAVQLAAAYMGQEKWDEALKLYNYALTYEPAAGDILSMRGWAYLEKGSETSATADFKEALKFLPDDARTLEGLERLKAEQ